MLTLEKTVLMHIDNNISYFIDDFLIRLIILFIGWELGRKEEFTGSVFFYLYGLVFSESIISKTHHG